MLARGYGANPRLLLVDEGAEVRRVAADSLAVTISRIGTLSLPEPIRSRETRYQRHAARLLREFEATGDAATPGLAAEASPIASDPALREKLAIVKRVRRKERELAKLERRKETVSTGLVDAFHRRMRLLEERGYTTGWELTQRGDRLRFVYNELDLLLSECVEEELLAGLDAAALAAVASLFTYEQRLADATGDWPSALVAERGEAIFDVGDELAATELRYGIEPVRMPDPGFAAVAFDWTEGASLEDLFGDDEVGAGDFVRNMRQLLDLLRQLRDAYPDLASPARLAIQQIDRGVVAAGGHA
jgi:ATP-dependent RNA helicase HelY